MPMVQNAGSEKRCWFKMLMAQNAGVVKCC
jgi:hypothetical protein